jgi:CBS-domain-containing membrane protein
MPLECGETARNEWRRIGLHNTAEGAIAGLGAAIAIGAMEWLSVASHFPLVIIPFATAQPRALIGGHLVATLAGLAMLPLTGPHAWAAAAAVGVAIAAMVVTGTFHPPAGINPLLVVSNNPPWSFSFAPVLAGAMLLAAFAYVWHRRIRCRPWPRRWF